MIFTVLLEQLDTVVLTFPNVVLLDLDVLVPIWSGVLMIKAQGVHHFVQNSTHVA
jgi:hypothetical protein